MILFPPAKINLGLNVLHKREDGYHEIESCMIAIPFYDVLEIIPAKTFEFQQSGITIAGDSEDNLCVKAFRLLEQNYAIPPVSIYLRKIIPMGAGLGGGSADASYVVKAIVALYKLGISEDEQRELVTKLGSDCPFFISSQPQLAIGRGEILQPIAVDLKNYYLKLINPGIHIGTKEAYDGIQFSDDSSSVAAILDEPIENWKSQLKNDFERTAFKNHPTLAQIKASLYEEGAIYAAMSGSGSTLFGIFKEEPKLTFSNENYLELIRPFA
jgi:4-diphosphocytidyl-2-C-methyl-D-erythritol kinase